jgi:hypothetical protein
MMGIESDINLAVHLRVMQCDPSARGFGEPALAAYLPIAMYLKGMSSEKEAKTGRYCFIWRGRRGARFVKVLR